MDGMVGNRYVIRRSIGEGGMADVYLAQDTILKRESWWKDVLMTRNKEFGYNKN